MSDGVSLEERIQRLEDRQAIEDLVLRYLMAVDDRDLETVVDCFTEDASLSGFVVGSGAAAGREGLRDHFRRLISAPGPNLHYHHGQLVEFEDRDHASGVVDARAQLSHDDTCIVGAFRYVDRYRRDGDRWRISDREVKFWYMMKLAELPVYFSHPLRKRWPGPAAATALPESLETYRAAIGDSRTDG